MKQTLMILQLALGIIPQIVEIVKAVEVPGHGAEKLNLVGALVEQAFTTLPSDIQEAIGATKIGNYARQIVGLIVPFLNITGVFTKAPTPKPVVAAAR